MRVSLQFSHRDKRFMDSWNRRKERWKITILYSEESVCPNIFSISTESEIIIIIAFCLLSALFKHTCVNAFACKYIAIFHTHRYFMTDQRWTLFLLLWNRNSTNDWKRFWMILNNSYFKCFLNSWYFMNAFLGHIKQLETIAKIQISYLIMDYFSGRWIDIWD